VLSVPFEEVWRADVWSRSGKGVVRVATRTAVWSHEYFADFDLLSAERATRIADVIMRRSDPASAADVVPNEATPERFLFERIDGGDARAEELAATILRQKGILAKAPRTRSEDESACSDGDTGAEDEYELPVMLGRGVIDWVEAHGGRLYVWGDPFSDVFETMKASAVRPPGVDFVRSNAVTDFELHVERGLRNAGGVRLGRRWFGLRDGISVDTHFVLDAGA
jgi:hypothetical protein